MEQPIILCGPGGKETTFLPLDTITYNQCGYAVLRPLEDNTNEILILKIVDDYGHRKNYESVVDEEELSAVYHLFLLRMLEDDK